MTNQTETTYTVIVKSDKKIEDREVTESISHTLKIKGIENYSIKTGSVTDEKSAFQEWNINKVVDDWDSASTTTEKRKEGWNALADEFDRYLDVMSAEYSVLEISTLRERIAKFKEP